MSFVDIGNGVFLGESKMQGDGSVGVVTDIVPRWYERTLRKSRSGLPYISSSLHFGALLFIRVSFDVGP